VKIIEYEKKTDNRGFSYSIYNKGEMEKAGIFFDYKEEKMYYSQKAGTLYGIHFQNNPKAQAKLLYCIEGRGIDYVVDLRKNSTTYLKWISVELSSENRKQIYIPKGFGHVFLSLEDNTRNVMRFDEPFDTRYSRQIAYNDPDIGIDYPIKNLILAAHDINARFLAESDVDL
jgi:dTDP-4-dehydrorhamnose 3,5-epimerase